LFNKYLWVLRSKKLGAWWCISVIPALTRLRQEDLEASLGYIVRPYLKRTKMKPKPNK
jgi:hypothetical protein